MFATVLQHHSDMMQNSFSMLQSLASVSRVAMFSTGCRSIVPMGIMPRLSWLTVTLRPVSSQARADTATARIQCAGSRRRRAGAL